jgi:hypothetical protein
MASGARFALGLERVHALEALPLGFPSLLTGFLKGDIFA